VKKITIGNAERDLRDATGGWIREHVEAWRNRGMPVCVRVQIKTESVDVAFQRPLVVRVALRIAKLILTSSDWWISGASVV
jgi:hypothetical protein